VFDKTGTLTKGEFGIKKIILRKGAGLDKLELLRLAAAIELHSQHLIAKGIVEEARRKNLKISQVLRFKSYPGKGAVGQVEGREVAVGSKSLLQELNIPEVKNFLNIKGYATGTLVYIAIEKRLVGAILLTDIIKEESVEAVKKLHKMGIKVALLTGDAKDVAEEVGKKIGVDRVFAQVLPDEKVNKIKNLQSQGNIVAMVGDGVNDAPSLAQAHVGIAIGAGTDVAIESADIVLIKNDPRDVVKAINLSRRTFVKMAQNLVWATGYNLFAIPAAAGIFYPWYGIVLRPEWSAMLMSASSIIVVLNALLLTRARLD
jgi:Cu2+-exporting ATPase